MMEGWKKVKLGDVLDKIIGGGTPSKNNQAYWNGNIPWCSVKDMSDDKFLVSSTEDTISDIGLKNSATNLISKGTVVTATRMGLGRAFIAGCDMAINQDLKALIPNSKIDNNFLLWLIIANRETLNNLGTGATVKGIRLETLRGIKINLPPLPTQRKIATILSAYDNLIENNLKRIKLLEEKAQLTYEEWFVRLKFPGHETTPINPETGLPEGWEKVKLKDIGEIITGKTPSTTKDEYFNGDIPFIKTPNISGPPYVMETTDYLTQAGADTQKKKFLPKNSLVVSCIGSAGEYALVAKKSQFNQQINAIKFLKEEYTFYTYCFAKHLKPWLDALGSNGATMTNVNKGKFEKIDITKPNEELLKIYHKNVKSNFEVIYSLMQQNQLLKEARDILLPRLMTGMVDVDELKLKN